MASCVQRQNEEVYGRGPSLGQGQQYFPGRAGPRAGRKPFIDQSMVLGGPVPDIRTGFTFAGADGKEARFHQKMIKEFGRMFPAHEKHPFGRRRIQFRGFAL
jgi:hypothetical protein